MQTVFQGTTLRGLLFEAYAFWTFGQIALYAAIASLSPRRRNAGTHALRAPALPQGPRGRCVPGSPHHPGHGSCHCLTGAGVHRACRRPASRLEAGSLAARARSGRQAVARRYRFSEMTKKSKKMPMHQRIACQRSWKTGPPSTEP